MGEYYETRGTTKYSNETNIHAIDVGKQINCCMLIISYLGPSFRD